MENELIKQYNLMYFSRMFFMPGKLCNKKYPEFFLNAQIKNKKIHSGKFCNSKEL
jgi:hypothetical protein